MAPRRVRLAWLLTVFALGAVSGHSCAALYTTVQVLDCVDSPDGRVTAIQLIRFLPLGIGHEDTAVALASADGWRDVSRVSDWFDGDLEVQRTWTGARALSIAVGKVWVPPSWLSRWVPIGGDVVEILWQGMPSAKR